MGKPNCTLLQKKGQPPAPNFWAWKNQVLYIIFLISLKAKEKHDKKVELQNKKKATTYAKRRRNQ